MKPQNDYFTVSQASEVLQLSPRTVYELLNSGDMHGRKIGGSWRIPRAELFPKDAARRKIATEAA